MHVTFHYALGVVIAGIASQFFFLTPIYFGIIVLAACLPDIDILFKKYAPDNNHRQLFTHSLYPGIIISAFGIIFGEKVIILFGIAYISHIFIDLFDWGTNFLFTGKTYGPRLLLKKSEHDSVMNLLKNEKIPKWFFVRRYYSARYILLLEIAGLLSMSVILVFMARKYWYFSFGYLFALSFHTREYYLIQKAIKQDVSLVNKA